MTIWVLFACGENKPNGHLNDTLDALDAREVWPESDADIILTPPDIVVLEYTDQQMCWTTTYTGPDVGIIDGVFRQSDAYGHHVIVMRSRADEDDLPDGTVIDCTEATDMTDMEPFILPSEIGTNGLAYLELPDGMGNKLKSGTRLMVQSHHINATGAPVLVNDRVELYSVPTEDIETFVAPLAHTSTTFDLPPGEHEISITCSFENDYNFLYILGHMHEWGQFFSIDYNRADGTTERIYTIEQWDVLYRDLPPIESFDGLGFSVLAGESFTTTCRWDNTTGETLGFPEEMCVSTGMIFPSTVTMICDQDPD